MASWFLQYKNSLKAIEIEEFFDLVFYRPLAFLLVKLIYRTSITPNQLTYTALLFGIVAGICFSQGTAQFFTYGALAYLLFNVFDCSDGQLARLKRNGTPTGRIIDGVADYLAGIAVYSGIGIGFVAKQEDNLLWFFLLIGAAASHVVHSMITDFYRQRFIRLGFGEFSPDEDADKQYKMELARLRQKGGSYFDRTILRIYLSYSSRQSKLTGNKQNTGKGYKITPAEYYRANKLIMRLWTLLGPTTQITFLIITALLYRPDIYILGMLIAFNALAFSLFVVQGIIDRRHSKTVHLT